MDNPSSSTPQQASAERGRGGTKGTGIRKRGLLEEDEVAQENKMSGSRVSVTHTYYKTINSTLTRE